MNQILRAPWHDYTSRCIYMVTINKSPLVKDFGALAGDYRISAGEKGCSFVQASDIGCAIKNVLRRFCQVEPNIRVLQYVIMPDHLHILLFVESPTAEILGRIIARFKVEVNKAVGMDGVFAKGFNDQILKPSRSLDILYKYIRDNPRRLAVRRAHPEYYRRVNSLEIAGQRYAAYGNLYLLQNPFKEQVEVHRKDTSDQRKQNHDMWLYTAVNGGVLVSPFISPAEKAIRAEAEEVGAKIILITNDPMPERYKPPAHDFALCEAGRLLIISLPAELSRSHCMAMNTLAESITRLN